MGMLSCHMRRLRAGITLALFAGMLAASTAALADVQDDARSQSLNCPGRETLVRVDENVCPPNAHRPLIVRKRACCQNPQGRVHCDHFEHCPNESPS